MSSAADIVAADRGRTARALVLGATGMLGHVVRRECERRMETFATMRSESDDRHVIAGVRAEDPDSVARAIGDTEPSVVVNCIGVVKQSSAAADAVGLVTANSLFPHQLAAECDARGVRLLHVSTDCVFSGRRGGYAEDDLPDPTDLYGRSKLAGEVSGPGTVTVRASMIGRELGTQNGLLEWLLSQPAGGSVRGFANAVFSGPTAPELARAIVRVAADQPELEGTFHVGAEPISKYDLLLGLRDAFGLELEIERSSEPVIDRSLNSERFRAATGWNPPPWDRMVAELAATTDLQPEAIPDAARR
jgi:dTDP-4-dehydrorhamnose reductase